MSQDSIETNAATFLTGRNRCVKAGYRWRFKRFAQYLGFKTTDWTNAIQSVIDAGQDAGQQHIRGFKPWLRSRNYPVDAANGCKYGIRPFFQYLRMNGLVPWTLTTPGQDRVRQDWERCQIPYRRFAEAWLKSLDGFGYKKDTFSTFGIHLRHFGLYLKRRRLTIKACHYRHVSQWIRELRASGMSPGSANFHVRTASRLCEFLVENGELPDNPFKGVGFQKIPSRLPDFLDKSEVVRLITTAWTPRDRAILELFYATGCRPKEISSLNVTDLLLHRRTIRCSGPFAHERLLPINFNAAKALKAYLRVRRERKDKEALFYSHLGGRLGLPGIREMLAKVARRAGIRKPVTPDILRNSFATHFLNNGGKAMILKHMLGHNTFAATTRFSKIATSRLRKVYDRTHPRP